MSEEKYLQFLCTFCVQACYRVSSTQLYDHHSFLKEHTMMPQDDYHDVWKIIAEKNRLPTGTISSSQSRPPIWEEYETVVNKMLRSISITERQGKISLALDDDKIWLYLQNSAMQDLFNLKFTRHVKPNRTGIIAHRAISSGAMIPLGVVFEKRRDSSVSCFKQLLDYLFNSDSVTNLRNVHVHSDRGYMIPSLVFEYLLSSGAKVVGTIKQMAFCWPFTYNQRLRENDKRSLIESKGAPTLFLKYSKAGAKKLVASAFCNGSESVAMGVSTLHTEHEWEGVVLKPEELIRYQKDQCSLKCDFFQQVDVDGTAHERLIPKLASTEESDLLDDLLMNEIEPYTLRQGTADWHYLRKFSLRSSQAHGAFVHAIELNKHDLSWVAVAQYLYGNELWPQKLNVVADEDDSANDDVESSNSDQSHDGDDDSSNPNDHNINPILLTMPIHNYLLQVRDDYERSDEFERDLHKHKAVLFLLFFTTKRNAVHIEEGTIDPNLLGLIVHPSMIDIEDDLDVTALASGGIILNDKVEATTFIRSIPAQVRRNAIEILCNQVPEAFQYSNYGQSHLITFVTSSNLKHPYIMHKIDGLKAIMEHQKIKIATGSKQANDFIEVLAGEGDHDVVSIADENSQDDDALPPWDAAIHSILKKSFLPHQKGVKRDACTLGHRLEKPILKNWAKLVLSKERSPVPGIEIHGVYSTGLAAKQGASYCKDSIDFVVFVKDPKLKDGGMLSDDDESSNEILSDDLTAWGFECKGRVTTRIAAEEEGYHESSRAILHQHRRIRAEQVHAEVKNVHNMHWSITPHQFTTGFPVAKCSS